MSKNILLTEIMENGVSEDRSPGWKSREMEQEYTEIAVNFVNALHERDFLKLEFDSNDEHIKKILLRLTGTNQSFGKLDTILSDLEKFSSFKEAITPFDLEGDDIMRLYTALLVHTILEEFEFLKTIMLMITEKKQYGTSNRGEPKTITGKETLGTLLNKYDEIVPDNKLHDVVDNRFRNVLGHGKWWTSQTHFCFEKTDGTIEQYEIHEFLLQAIKLSTFLKCFYEKGFERATQIKRGQV